MERDPALQELLMRRGNIGKIADACGISKAAVYAWPKVPAERVAAVADAVGVPKWLVRPDLWDAPAASRARV